MAAVFSTFAALLHSGDHIVSSRSVFGSTHGLFTNILPKWNIQTSYFKVDEVDNLEKLGRIAKKHKLIFIVDNCFATPYIQKPIDFGAHLVIHSATKLIDGQGRVLGGVTVGDKDLIRKIYLFARNTGPALSPFNAWVLSKSLETLAIRLERHCKNALKVAQFLENHAAVKQVKYPFLKSHPQYDIAKRQMTLGGNIIAFEIKNGVAGGRTFLNALQLCSLSANLGDTRTIITHPASTTHAKLADEDKLAVGITPGLVRCSIGLEHHEDVILDIETALQKVLKTI